jgi:ATP-binding cassette subfamily B protein
MTQKYKTQWEDVKNLRRLWPYVLSEKWIFTVTVLLIPVISVIQLAQPLILKNAIDKGVMSGNLDALNLYAGLYFGLVVCEYLSRSSQSITSTITVERMIKNMRQKLLTHLLHRSLSFHHRTLSGVLVTRSTSEFDNLSESLNEGVLQSIVGVVAIIGCVVGMISLHPLLGVISTLTLPLVIGMISWFSQKIKISLLAARKHLALLNGYTQECFQGMASVKVLSAEHTVSHTFKQMNEKFRQAQMTSVTFDAILFSVLEGASSIIIGLVLWVILKRLHLDSHLSAGVIVAFVRYLQQVFDPLKQLGQTVAFLQGVFTSTERIFNLFDQQEGIHGDKIAEGLQGNIRIRDLSFSYNTPETTNGNNFALHNINLDVQSGQSIALVGPTGGGKSTLIKLLTKQYEGFIGEIKLDDQDIYDLEPFSLRRMIGIVPQDLVLFSGSIAFNISLAHPDVGPDDIEYAAKLVGLHDFILTLPDAYEFNVQEGGSNLSIGQKQLIVFARALAHRPKLIILDEATSSLDPQSESLVQNALDTIFKLKTVIVIAHRLSTVRNCHKIVVIQGGRIVEEGNHEELLAKHGLYHALSFSLV